MAIINDLPAQKDNDVCIGFPFLFEFVEGVEWFKNNDNVEYSISGSASDKKQNALFWTDGNCNKNSSGSGFFSGYYTGTLNLFVYNKDFPVNIKIKATANYNFTVATDVFKICGISISGEHKKGEIMYIDIPIQNQNSTVVATLTDKNGSTLGTCTFSTNANWRTGQLIQMRHGSYSWEW